MNTYPGDLYSECAARGARKLSRDERQWSEAKSHGALARWLRAVPHRLLHDLDWWHTENEGHGLKSARQGRQSKAMGVTAGVADFIVAVPGDVRGFSFCGVCVELKRPDRTGRVSDEQMEFLARRRRGGWIAEVCNGHHEAIELLCACYGW